MKTYTEIKLALDKNRETHLQFGLYQDLEALAKKHEKQMEKADALWSQTAKFHRDILTELDRAYGIIEKGSKQVQELGLKDDQFQKVKLGFDLEKRRVEARVQKLS